MATRSVLARILAREEGQDLIEYSLLIGIITAASLLAVAAIGGKIAAYFTSLSGVMP